MLSECVDFTLGKYSFSLAGDGTIKLSELMAKLDVNDFDVSRVSNVTFTDELLVSVEKDANDDDWTLTSLQPFTSSETLTIEMVDGTKYIIYVTDEQKVDTSNWNKSIATDFGNYITGTNTFRLENGQWVKPTDNKFTDGDQVDSTID